VNSTGFPAAAVAARDLGFHYGAVVALESLDLDLEPGAVSK
jgi:hypothetical protein